MKYRETKVVNYRQEDDDSNTLSTCTFLDCDEYRTDYDRQIDTTRQKQQSPGQVMAGRGDVGPSSSDGRAPDM